MAKVIGKEEFAQVIASKDKPVLIDFFADWCGPCKMLAPILEQVAEEYAGQAEVYKVNVDEESGLAAQYGVQSIPTVIVFQDGEVKKTNVGFIPKDQLVAMLGL